MHALAGYVPLDAAIALAYSNATRTFGPAQRQKSMCGRLRTMSFTYLPCLLLAHSQIHVGEWDLAGTADTVGLGLPF